MPEKTNTEEEKSFFAAIRQGDKETVQRRVAANGALLSSYDYGSFGATPLTLVTFCGDREMVDVLLDLGVDIDRKSDWEMGPWSPMHTVIQTGDTELAEHLLGRGATLDVHGAAALNRIDPLTQMLDESPGRVHELGGDGCHPLHFAGSESAVDLLLERGADIEARCLDHYSTPVQYRSEPRPDIARYLVAQGATPDVFSASMAGDVETVTRLISENASVVHERINQERFPPGPVHDVHNIMTFTVGGNATAMHAAARGNQVEVVTLLTESGADVNAQGGYDESSPLHLAAWNDHSEVAAKLIAHGAKVDQLTGEIHNNSPAGWALVAGSTRVFELLLDHGAEIKEWFAADAEAGANGAFRDYKTVPLENYEQIRRRITKT